MPLGKAGLVGHGAPGTAHGDVADVRVDISLPHGIRQLEPGYPRALLGLDAVEHLVRMSSDSQPGMSVAFGVDSGCTCAGASSVRTSVPITGCLAGTPLYETLQEPP